MSPDLIKKAPEVVWPRGLFVLCRTWDQRARITCGRFRDAEICIAHPRYTPVLFQLQSIDGSELLGNVADHVAAGKGIEHKVAGPCEKLDKKLRNLVREAGGMNFKAVLTACFV